MISVSSQVYFYTKLVSSTNPPQTNKHTNKQTNKKTLRKQSFKWNSCSWKMQQVDSLGCVQSGSNPKGLHSPVCETHVNDSFLEKYPFPPTSLLQIYSQMFQQPQYLGPSKHWFWNRKIMSLLANICSLSLPAPVPRTQLHEISVLFREHLECYYDLVQSLKKQRKPMYVPPISISFSR